MSEPALKKMCKSDLRPLLLQVQKKFDKKLKLKAVLSGNNITKEFQTV